MSERSCTWGKTGLRYMDWIVGKYCGVKGKFGKILTCKWFLFIRFYLFCTCSSLKCNAILWNEKFVFLSDDLFQNSQTHLHFVFNWNSAKSYEVGLMTKSSLLTYMNFHCILLGENLSPATIVSTPYFSSYFNKYLLDFIFILHLKMGNKTTDLHLY